MPASGQIALKISEVRSQPLAAEARGKPICEQPRIKKVLEVYLASDSPIPPLDRIASSLGYAVDRSLWQKCPELCRALSAKIEGQTRTCVAIEPALEQTFQGTRR